jgi:hypothetical protein
VGCAAGASLALPPQAAVINVRAVRMISKVNRVVFMEHSCLRNGDGCRLDDGDGHDQALDEHGFSFASIVCYYSGRTVTCGDIL